MAELEAAEAIRQLLGKVGHGTFQAPVMWRGRRRAAERVHEQLRAEAAVTELEVERAGTEAVMTEITRLQQEREQLTASMKQLGGIMLLDDELFGPDR